MNSYLEIDNDLLVEECIKGNPEALSLFYTRFAPKMLSIVRRYVTNPKDAEDILHDGFLVAFTRLNTIRNAERVEYWLASIMKNLSLQFLQAQDLVTILHEIPEVEDSPDFSDIIDLATLESLIQELPKGYQSVFRLSVLEHKTHKEIAKILGIAPNTSSSQLFHAKMMMRRLISEHRRKAGLISLFLIILSAGILWRLHTDSGNHDNIADTNIPALPADTIAKNTVPLPVKSPVTHNLTAVTTKTSITVTTDTINVNPKPEPTAESKDSTAINPIQENVNDRLPELPMYAHSDDYIYQKPSQKNGWSFKLSTGAAITFGTGISGGDDMTSLIPGPVGPGPVPGVPNPSKPFDPPLSTPGIDDDKSKSRKMRGVNRTSYDFAHHNDLPVTVAATFNKSVSKVIGIETGLVYTYLHSTFEHNAKSSDCSWHYLGIPLKVTVNNYSSTRFRLYATAGAQFDMPLYSYGSLSTDEYNSVLPHGTFRSSAVLSLTASYGVGFNMTNSMGIFAEPSIQYHFYHNYEVPNAWTDSRFSFSLPVGIRFNF